MQPRDLSLLLQIPDLPNSIDRVNAHLIDCFRSVDMLISRPSLRLIKTGGKRIRSCLVIAANRACGGATNEDVIIAATAIELAHLGSLVHDDILDAANLRGNQPSIYAQEGSDAAIIVGDYFLTLATELASRISARAANTTAMAILKMCEGQMQETADDFNVQRSRKRYEDCVRGKTGALLGAATELGAITAEADSEKTAALRCYGEQFGMVFQLIDDLMDFLASEKVMGKPVHNDAKEGVYTLPLILSLAGPASKDILPILDHKPLQPQDYDLLIDILKKDGSLATTLAAAQDCGQKASEALRLMPQSKAVKGLSRLPEYYIQQIVKNQAVLPIM
jgi:geranylgeranyl pyrophosphate synthase